MKVLKETRMTLRAAAQELGRPVTTLRRWIRPGLLGTEGQTVVLESYREGGRLMTSREALERFFWRLET